MGAVKISYYRQMDDINCNKSPSRFCALLYSKVLHHTFYPITKSSKKIIYFELYFFSSKYILILYFIMLIDLSFPFSFLFFSGVLETF